MAAPRRVAGAVAAPRRVAGAVAAPRHECNKLSFINNNINFLANSGIKEAVAKRIIRHRPYGGVAFLWLNSLIQYI